MHVCTYKEWYTPEAQGSQIQGLRVYTSNNITHVITNINRLRNYRAQTYVRNKSYVIANIKFIVTAAVLTIGVYNFEMIYSRVKLIYQEIHQR